jgi:hypothetical protein
MLGSQRFDALCVRLFGRGDGYVDSTFRLRLRYAGCARDQTREVRQIIRYEPLPASCGKQDAPGLCAAVSGPPAAGVARLGTAGPAHRKGAAQPYSSQRSQKTRRAVSRCRAKG